MILLIQAVFSTAQYVHTYYVTPDSSITFCGENPCNDLNTYVQNETILSLSNTKCVLLPGVHHLNIGGLSIFKNSANVQLLGSMATKITIAQMAEMYGFDPYSGDDEISYFESSTIILCDSPSGLLFANISNLEILNLTVLNCGAYSASTSYTASVHLDNVLNVTIDGVSIRNSTGYGLMGVNILGQSQFIRSSFVGNNQYLKDGLTKKYEYGFGCNGNPNIAYVNKGALPSVTGGNFYLRYNDQIPNVQDMTSNQLSFVACLFSLGMDGIFGYQYGLFGSRSGTGLSIFTEHSTYNVSIAISQTTLYRNQAEHGANLYLEFNSLTTYITIANVQSTLAIGLYSGILLKQIGLSSTSLDNTTSVTNVTDSSFKCTFYSTHGTAINIEADASIYSKFNFNNCTFNQSDATLVALNAPVEAHFDICHFTQTNLEVVAHGQSQFIKITNSSFQHSDLDFSETRAEEFIINITDCHFIYSSASIRGFSLKINAYLSDCTFISSSVLTSYSVIHMSNNITFTNSLRNANGGALVAVTSEVIFETSSNVAFINNTAVNGGAVFMDWSSVLNLTSHANLSFIRNNAFLSGGAIYVSSDSTSLIRDTGKCFLAMQGSPRDTMLYFEDNRAGEAGSMLYGGDLMGACSQLIIYQSLLRIGYYDNTTSLIASEPQYLCPCDYGKKVYSIPVDSVLASLNRVPCSSTPINKTVYPGQTLLLPLMTLGQANGTAPAIVLVYSNITDIEFITAIRTSAQCDLYSIPFKYVNGVLYLTTQTSFSNGQFNLYNIQLSVTVLKCPTGFVLDNASSTCVCEQLLTKNKFTCNITDQTMQRAVNTWIGYTPQGYFGIISQCPPDYCGDDLKVSVANLDGQCINNRQKVLCGQCQDGLSTMFGSSLCKDCSNYYILLVIPFAVMGIALVGLLFLFNITVSSGTLTGLIFYANILKINDEIFFPPNYENVGTEFFLAFISWLNLDVGIETCFYNGMDSYAKTWLQFVFPAYLYIIVGIIIFAGRYSSRISNLCRFNAVPVLCTILLISYSKIVRTVMLIFSPLSIETQEAVALPSVWFYDGNLEFLGPRHVGLFIFGLLVTFLIIIPYTATLLLFPFLQKKSNWMILWWVNKLKPFFDSYAAPYKDRYRFWPGILLIVRLPLYTLFAIEFSITLRLVGIIMFVYVYSLLLIGLSVYKRWQILLLELFFHFNLITISIAHLVDANYDTSTGLYAILLTGVCGSFVGFLAIIIYHIRDVLPKKEKPKTLLQNLQLESVPVRTSVGNENFARTSVGDKDDTAQFREPLLAD